MKPRTKFQKYILSIFEKGVQPIGNAQKEWAFKHQINHYAFRLKSGMTTCSDCGHTWITEDTDTCHCPKCKAKLSVLNTLRRTESDSTYFSVLDTKGEFQLLRMFLLKVAYRKGQSAKRYYREIGQYWMDANGNYEIIALKRTLDPYVDCFSYYAPMELRYDNDVFRHIAQFPVCPICKTIPQIGRSGFKGLFYNIDPLTFFSSLLKDYRMEILLKADRITDFTYFVKHHKDLDKCWNAYKITLRNQYTIEDTSIWVDYINLLKVCGKDIHNAHYVCPENLFKEHDRYVTKAMRIEEKNGLSKLFSEISEKENAFRAMKERFFGLQFTDGTIEVKILESVMEHYYEGKGMHHCVYSNRYYSNPNVLIFSARINDRRIETVEFSLESMNVTQCRGVCNQNTEYHDRIVSLVNNNRYLIRERMTA